MIAFLLYVFHFVRAVPSQLLVALQHQALMQQLQVAAAAQHPQAAAAVGGFQQPYLAFVPQMQTQVRSAFPYSPTSSRKNAPVERINLMYSIRLA